MVTKTIGIEIDPSGAERGGRVVRTNLTQIADEAQKAEAATQRLGTSMTESVAKAGQTVQAVQRVGTTAARSAALAGHEVTNLSYQMNDIAMMLASGQSPFIIMAQQGMQVSQIMGNRGLGQIIPAIGTGIASLVNPTTIALAGVTALGYGATAIFSAMQGEIRAVDDVLADHEANIRGLKDAWGEAASGVKAYAAESRAISSLRNAATEIELRLAVASGAKDALDTVTGLTEYDQRTGEVVFTLNSQYREFAGAIDHLRQTAAAGQPDILGFRQMVTERWNLDPNNEALTKTAQELIKLTDETAMAARALPAAEQAAERVSSSLFKMSDALRSASASSKSFAGGTGMVNAINATDANVRSLQSVAASAADANRQHLQTLLAHNAELRAAKDNLTNIQRAIAKAASDATIEDFFGDVSHIKDAQASIEDAAGAIEKVFAAFRTGGAPAATVAEAIDMVRESLIQMGFDAKAVDAFVDTLVAAQMQSDALSDRVKALSQNIAGIPNRTIDIIIREHTVRTTSGGTGSVRVQGYSPSGTVNKGDGSIPLGVSGSMSLYPGGSLGDIFGSGVNVHRGTLSGTRATGGPVEAGGTYLVGEQGPEIVTMASAGNVATASSTASILAGGRDKLSMIEENTFQTTEEVKRSIGYLEAIDEGQEASLKALQAIEKAIGSATRSSGGGSYSGGSGGSSGGGFSSGGGGGVYSSNDPKSPYFYRNSTQPGGAVYDPLADAMLNGNMGALRNLTASQMGNINTGISPGLSSQEFYSNMINSLIKGGPQLGTYGGGTNITADSDFLSRSGMFGGGSAQPGRLTDRTLQQMMAQQEQLAAYGANRGTAATMKKLGFDSGGIIHPGDTQKVDFFKRPDEAVAILRPDQRRALADAYDGQFDRGREAGRAERGNITIVQHNNISGDRPQEAAQAVADKTRRAILDVTGGL